MSREARQKSSTGIYHVMLRGINKQDIFNDDEDRIKFCEILRKNKENSAYSLYGYCLMSNHVHLLLKEEQDSISRVMKRIGTSYAYWFNTKYERNGHLFQDRYRSERVDDERYLLTVLRYIHRNPIKAGIIAKADQYSWSSYFDYITFDSSISDTDFILDLLSPDRQIGRKLYIDYMDQENEDKCHDFVERPSYSDQSARDAIMELVNSANINVLLQMKKKDRDAIIKKLKTKYSIRQLVRITGLGKGIIDRA
jgi:REP element-mobilizing transposase RayT